MEIARLEVIQARAKKKGRRPDCGLPDLDPGEYLVGVMNDLGATRPSGEGNAPTDWPVIYPFGEAIGLDSEDMLILSKMCRGYYQAWCEGRNPLAIAPVERGKDAT
jgi:hypothetical protein